MRCLLLIALCLVLSPFEAPPLAASTELGSNEIFSEEEVDERVLRRRRQRAAQYRLARAEIGPTLPPTYHAAAAIALNNAIESIEGGDLERACELAEEALETWPYSDSAARTQHVLLRAYAAASDMTEMYNHLVDLWERHPDYNGIDEALQECLVVSEVRQNAAAAINLNAVDPEEVINIDVVGGNQRTNRMFRFLGNRGDPVDVGPRAALGLARAMLFEASERPRDYLIPSRQAYTIFLETYPRHPLVFEALCEQSLTFLIGHRGDRFDGGVLDTAADIIDQAEEYTNNLPERAAMVEDYRALIVRWRQAHDLEVARWYRKEDLFAAAQTYYQAVIDRGGDPDSSVVLDARRELAELEPELADTPAEGDSAE